MIETTQQLKSLMERALATDAVGIDTEFFWERTYFPRLGLIQIALSQDECFLIDPLAIKDLSSLGTLLAEPTVVKIFHDSSQDLGILRKATNTDPQNIFDTRIAAGFAGRSSILSLLVLVQDLLGVTLNKSQTRTNWLKRPLSVNQMKYGLEDVRYLRQLRRLFLGDVQPTVQGWLAEELLKFDNPDSYMGIADGERYIKVRGASRLERKGLAILSRLADWREKEARKCDKPRGHIIKDEILLHIAGQQVEEVAALHDCEGISVKSIGKYGKVMTQLVTQTLAQDDTTYPTLLRQKRLSKTEEATLRTLQKNIARQAESLGVDPALLGNKAELKGLIQKRETPSRQKTGWRKKFLAELKM